MATAKVTINGNTILDLTPTTATAADVASAKKFFAADGTETTGAAAGGKHVQIAQSTTRASSTSYTKIVSLTCGKAGTYHVYWTGFRSSTSGTWGSQLYLGSSAYGSEQSTFTNHIQNVHLSNVQIAANQNVEVRARSRGSNYYAYVSNLVIIEQ